MIQRLFFILLTLTFFCNGQKITSESTLRFMASGDLNLAHWITPLIDSNGPDYLYNHINDFISGCDIFFVNLESPICEKGEAYPKNFVFNVPARHVKVLQSGKINVVSLANNHILDYGLPGLFSTIKELKHADIHYCGAGKNLEDAYAPAIIEINNIKVAFFAYSMTLPKAFWANDSTGGTAYPYNKIIKDRISACRQKSDIIVASFHWGKELSLYPEEYQIRQAHMAIDFGADLVLGHHPHNLQGVEVYKGKNIFYSLGNYIFASYSDKVKDGLILEADFTKDGIQHVKIHPINVNNYDVQFKPKLHIAEKKKEIINHLNEISLFLNDSLKVLNSDGFINLIN